MFVRAKHFDDRTYYYLVKNTWVDGKVVQKVIKYLGKNKKAAGLATLILLALIVPAAAETGLVGEWHLDDMEARYDNSTGLVAHWHMDDVEYANDSSLMGWWKLNEQPNELPNISGLVGHWHLNEGTGTAVYDSSGNGNTGTKLGTGSFWNSSGKFGTYGLTFNGSDDSYVSIPDANSLDLGTGNFTIGVWVKVPFSGFTSWNGIVAKGFSTSANPNTWGVVRYSTLTNSVGYQDVGDVGGSFNAALFSPTLSDGWHNIVVTRAGTNYSIYVDGIIISSQTKTAVNLNNAANLGFAYYGNKNWNGTMDEVAILNRAMPPEEVKHYFGGVAKDYSGRGNNGSLMNGGTWNPVWNSSGKFDSYGLSFDGIDDYIALPNAIPTIENGDYTIMSWIKKSSPILAQACDEIFNQDSDGNHQIRLEINNGTCYPSLTTYEGGYAYVVGTSSVCDGNWHQIVGVKSGTNGYLYVDGQLQTSGTAKNLNVGSTDKASIGVLRFGAASKVYYFNGSIDEVAIYNRSLSAAEIYKLAGAGIRDHSGNGNNGTVVGAAWNASGKFGYGPMFDGVDDSINVSDSASLDITGNLTISAWVKRLGPTAAFSGIVAKENTDVGTGYGIIYNSVPSFRTKIGGQWQSLDFPEFPLNTWTHVAATYNGTHKAVYVNGALYNTQGASGSIATNNYPLRIGRQERALDSHFNGTIDEVAIYNRALSAEEIQRQSGRFAFDTSGNGNTGTLTNSPAWTNASRFGTALTFDGINDYVTVPHSASLNLSYTGGTLELWMYARNYTSPTGNYAEIVHKGSDAGWDSPGYTIWAYGDVQGHISSSGYANNYVTFGVPSLNTWHHLVLTWNGSNVSAYLDGALNHRVPQTIINIANTEPLLMAKYNFADSMFFNGTIDEVRVYNRSLSADEVKAHANCNYTGGDWTIPSNTGVWCRARIATGGNLAISGNLTLDTTVLTTKNATNVTINAGGRLEMYNTTVLMGGSYNGENYVSNSGTLIANFTNFTRAAGYNYGFVVSSNATIHNSLIEYVQTNSMNRGFFVSGIQPGMPVSFSNNTFRSITSINGGNVALASNSGATINFTDNRVTGNLPLILCANFTNFENNVINSTSNYAIYTASSWYGTGTWGIFRNNTLITPTGVTAIFAASSGVNLTLINTTFIGSDIFIVPSGSYVYSKQHNANASDTRIYGTFNYTKPWLIRDTVGYWRFDEGNGTNAADYTNVNNGTINGATWGAGRFGRALSFDGVNDIVSVGGLDSLGYSDEVTVETWLYPRSYTDPGGGYQEPLRKEGAGGFHFSYIVGGGCWQIGFKNYLGGVYARCVAQAAIPLNKWTHVALVLDKTIVMIYINGVLNDSMPFVRPRGLNLANLYIGEYGGLNRWFNGSIDEVRVSKRALSPSEFLPFEHDSVMSVMPGASVRVGSDATVTFSNITENGTFTSDGVLYRYKPYPIRVVNGSGSIVSGASVNVTDNFTGDFNTSISDASGFVYPHAFQSMVNGSVLTTVKHNVTAAKAGVGWNNIGMNSTYGNQTISLGADQGFMIIGNLTNSSFTPNVTVGGSVLAGPYFGVRTVEIRSGSQIVATFVHDFSADDLNLSSLAVRLGQYWVGFSGKPSATLYVPLKGSFCNARVCPGIINTSETCTAGWNTADSDVQGWYCLTAVNSTVAEEQTDAAITKLSAAPIRWEWVAVLFAMAGAIALAPRRRSAKRRLP